LPWYPPENQGIPHAYKHPSIVFPPCYDTNLGGIPLVQVQNPGNPPTINFNDVPEGETAARAIVISAYACEDVHLSVTAGPTVTSGPPGSTFGTLLGTSVTVPHILSFDPPTGRLWISYRGTSAGDVATGTVTVHCTETNHDFVFALHANTIARKKVATMLVLDQSGSMDWLAGIDATTKRIDVLHQAASQFVQLAQDTTRVGDGVGMVSFDHNAYPGVGVTRNMGTGFDLLTVISAIQNLHPQGATSIGKGVELGRNTLNPVTGYDEKALIVFTDGLENTHPYIAEISSINDRTFAIGLGTAQQVSVGALTALANNTGGRLLLSGQLSPSIDDYFRLNKFFLQVLAGVQNTNIVTDPSGFLSPGMRVRIPFVLNEADIDATVILLSDLAVIRFLIETPAGDVMDPAQAGLVGATFSSGNHLSYYRFTLPLALGAQPADAGTWYALLELDEKGFDLFRSRSEQPLAGWSARTAHGIRYNLSAHSFSNLRMEARLYQTSMQPGVTMTMRAIVSEYGIPVEGRAVVRADLERPDGTAATISLVEAEPGVFEGHALASIPGVYRFRLRASGATMRGLPFTREQILTGATVPGGDNPPTPGPSTRDDLQLCELLDCLLRPEALGRFLLDHHVNLEAVRGCVEVWCKGRLGQPSEEELCAREGTCTTAAVSESGASTVSTELINAIREVLRVNQPGPKSASEPASQQARPSRDKRQR
jgi:hypothetical protein